MIATKEELIKNIETVIDEVKSDRKLVNEIKKKLLQNGVMHGKTQRILNGFDPLDELDITFLCLFTNALYEVTGNPKANPYQYFTKKEVEVAKRQDYTPETKAVEFPLVLDNVLMLNRDDYITTMPIKKIVEWFDANILHYNFETQRNPKILRRSDRIIIQPNINIKSVNEIEKKLLEGTFLPDTITFNVLLGSSVDETKDELVYDATHKRLIINESEIDILDGFHRITAFVNALRKNPELDFTVQVAIKNYNIRKAQSYVAQINTINKMDTSHLKSLKAERYSDFVTKELQRESDLRGKISRTTRPMKSNGELVSYATLADAIDEVFDIPSKKEAMDIAAYLTKFFDYLIGSFPYEFIDNPLEVSKKSLINHDVMFVGYIVLARRIKDENLPFSVAVETIKEIDFSRENPMWEKIKVLVNGRIATNAKRAVRKYFETLELKGDE